MITVSVVKAVLYVSEAASILGCSSEKVYGLIHSGKLNAHKEGKAWKILAIDLERYIQSLPRR